MGSIINVITVVMGIDDSLEKMNLYFVVFVQNEKFEHNIPNRTAIQDRVNKLNERL